MVVVAAVAALGYQQLDDMMEIVMGVMSKKGKRRRTREKTINVPQSV